MSRGNFNGLELVSDRHASIIVQHWLEGQRKPLGRRKSSGASVYWLTLDKWALETRRGMRSASVPRNNSSLTSPA